MRYTIWSRGRLIGATDLAFTCRDDLARGGWFHPNADGRRIMPVVASLLPAIRSYLEHDASMPTEAPELPDLPGSPQLADLREAFHRVATLDLELRDASGAVVPTTSIGIQDTHVLLELAREVMSCPDAPEVHEPDHVPHDGDHFDAEHELGPEIRVLWRDEDDGVDQCWFDPAPYDGDLDSDRDERYQVFLTLADGASVA